MTIKKFPFLFMLTLTLVSCLIEGRAQVYEAVTHVNGPQVINGRVVTVYPGPRARNEYSVCGIGPFRVGLNNPDTPGFYRFTFQEAVANLRVQATSINDSETVAFRVNGQPYLISPGQFSHIPTPCTLNVPALLIDGRIVGPPGAYGDSAAAAQAHITGNIRELRVDISNSGYGVHFNLSIEGRGVSVCEHDTLILPLISYPGATYHWEGPGGFTSTDQNPVIPDADTGCEGLYRVTVTTNTGSIVNTVYVEVLRLPVNEIAVPDAICLGSSLELGSTAADSGLSYLWEGPNGFTSQHMPLRIDPVQLYHSGIYTLTTYSGSCRYSTSRYVEVRRPVTHRMTRAACRNEPFVMNGVPLSETGIYQDTLVGSNGCDSFLIVNYIAFPVPEVSLELLHTGKLCMSNPVSLRAAGGTRYEWRDAHGAIGDGPSLDRVYDRDQHPQVWVTAFNDYNCKATDSITLDLRPCCTVYVPNAFTPNGDGVNDHFRAVVHGQPRDYLIRIYNRYGELVFLSTDPAARWDGTYKGVKADVGVYFFEFVSHCMDGSETYEKGDITLIR